MRRKITPPEIEWPAKAELAGVNKYPNFLETAEELDAAVMEEWDAVPPSSITSLKLW